MTSDGREVGRLRALWRLCVSWSPVIAYAAICAPKALRPIVIRDGQLIVVDDERMRFLPGEQPEPRMVRFRSLGCYPLSAAVASSADTVDAVIEKRGLVQISDAGAIDRIVAEVIAANPAQIEQFRAGKQQVLGFLVGQLMKASKGKANPQQVNDALRRQLGA